MGMEEGLTQAVGQIDAILAEDTRSRQETHDDHDDRADHPAPSRRTGRRPDLRRPAVPTRTPRPVLLLIGSPMGAGGFGTLAGPLPRPHDRHLRPARRGAQHEGRSRQPVDARAARRRPASDHRRARRRSRRPLRQQRRRGERARPRGGAPRAGRARSSRTSRRSPRSCPTARARWRPAARSTTRTRRSGFGAGMAQFIVAVSHQGPFGPDYRRPARAGSRRCSACRPRTTARGPTRCWARTSSPARTTSPTSTRCARRRPGSSSRAGAESEGQLAHRGAHAVAERLGTEPVDLPERPRRLPGRRVRPDGRPRRLRREAARGPRRGLTARHPTHPAIRRTHPPTTRAGGDRSPPAHVRRPPAAATLAP